MRNVCAPLQPNGSSEKRSYNLPGIPSLSGEIESLRWNWVSVHDGVVSCHPSVFILRTLTGLEEQWDFKKYSQTNWGYTLHNVWLEARSQILIRVM